MTDGHSTVLQAQKTMDLIVRGGRVIDPGNNLDSILDIAVQNGKIVAVEKDIKHPSKEEYLAQGCIVTPGLIDCHVHCYEYATPLGINPDRDCLSRGVTAVVDAGSAGSGTFLGLKKYVIDQSKTRVYALLHIAAHGLAAAGCAHGFGAGGECDSLNQVNVDLCTQCIKQHPEDIVGVKVRLTANVCNNGQFEKEVYRRARAAAKEMGLPLMVHHSFSSIPTQHQQDDLQDSCPGGLGPGDIYTHAFHGSPSSIIDPATNAIHADVLEAHKRGVLFDIGHGQGSFCWTVAELCAKANFWPDIIGTDLHTGNCQGPAYDLPTVMSKLYHVGMPLQDVIRATTFTPAKAIGKSGEIGSLSVGNDADITILKELPFNKDLEDCQAQLRKVTKLLMPVAVWRAGKQYEISKPEKIPNEGNWQSLSEQWEKLIIKDPR